jgi:hypothetical protein
MNIDSCRLQRELRRKLKLSQGLRTEGADPRMELGWVEEE